MKRKLFSLLILAALLLSLFPLAALAEEPAPAEDGEQEQEPAEEERKGNLWGIPAEDVIWYGVYNDSPVAWLVLDADQTNMGTEGVYLFSRDLIDSGKVSFDESSTLWEGSLAKDWCTNFAQSAFSDAESALIPATDKYEPATYPEQLYGITWAEMELKGEQVFFLSIPEMAQYFGSYAPGNKYTIKPCSMESYYWLRTPHYYHEDYHSMVLQSNMIHDKLPYEPWAARPCINLLLQDALWVLPAEDEGLPGPAARPGEERAEGDGAREWKLIVPQAEHDFRAETASREGKRLTVNYSGADTGENAMLSLLVRDGEGKPLSLLRLERPAAAEGSLTLDPEELGLPEEGELFLFCEQLNGPDRTNTASPLQELANGQIPEESPIAEAGPAAEEEPAEERPAEQEQAAPERPEAEKAPAAEEQEGSIAPVGEEKKESSTKKDMQLIFGRLSLIELVAYAVGAVLGIALLVTALRRRSILPVLMLILLALLALVVVLRIRFGQPPLG